MRRIVPMLLCLLATTCLQGRQAVAESQVGEAVGMAVGAEQIRTLTDGELRQLVGGGCGGAPCYKRKEDAQCTPGGCQLIGGSYYLVDNVTYHESCGTGANPGLTECYVAPNSSQCARRRYCGPASCDDCSGTYEAYLKRDTAMLSGYNCP